MLFYFACEAAGASAPGIPHALLEWKAERFIHTSDAFAPREYAGVCCRGEMVRRAVSAAVLPAGNRFPPRHAVLLTQDESFRAQKTSSNHAFVEPRNRLSRDLKYRRKCPCIQYLTDADF